MHVDPLITLAFKKNVANESLSHPVRCISYFAYVEG